jgi:hypothetical protein
MNGITDYIISLINRYPHLLVFFFLSAFFVITQLKYGWQAYHYKNERYTLQYRIVNKITTVIFLLVVIVTIVLFISCGKDDLANDTTIRTIIVYMAADNDLSADALSDIEEMKQGFSEAGVHLIVFVDVPDETPYLLEIGKTGISE